MSTTIRPATQADYAIIESIAQRTWPDTFAGILSKQQIDYMLAMMYSPDALREQVEEKGHLFLLLKEEAEPVGYVSYQHDYLPGTTKIHKIYLLPDRQGRGYGRLLIDAAFNKAREAGQPRLRLDVNYQNKAVGFYQHYGFEIIERVDTDIGHGYLMEDYVLEMMVD